MADWIGVACAEHVRRGVAGGFMQLCHGKAGPVRRVKPGDRIACYAPAERMRGTDGLRSFVALGTVREGDAYQVEMAPGFLPHRRDVAWWAATPAPIAPLLPRMAWSRGGGWGAKLRFGLLRIEPADMEAIAEAMSAAPPD
jgi:hypothetical protein